MAETKGTRLQGIGISSGVGMGQIHIIESAQLDLTQSTFTSAEEEIARLKQAIDFFCYRTYSVFQKMRSLLGQEDALILGGQIFMARDLEFIEEIHQEIRNKKTAEMAVSHVFATYLSYFTAMEDEVLAQRGADLKDMRDSILELLMGQHRELHFLEKTGVVLCARELSPSLMATITPDQVSAILCQQGGSTSHCAILARATGIPAVFGVENLLTRVTEGESVVVDGVEGIALLRPTPETEERYREKAKRYLASCEELEQYANLDTKNAIGDKMVLMANVTDLPQVRRGVDLGADGVGLFRTEFLYMDSAQLPTEDTQYAAYCRAAKMMEGKPVVIRTLDIGGDKEADCLPMELEDNPFLGLRGVRYCLAHQEIFITQLRAIVRATCEYDNISILIPFITQVEEIYQVKKILSGCMQDLQEEGVEIPEHISFGVVIETPAAAIMVDEIVEMVDFISVGTNDLLQYIGVADRGNPKVGHYYSPFQPSVLRMLKHIIGCCHRKNVPVTVCGEMVADSRMIPVLLSFGRPHFSVSPSAILSVRRELAGWTHREAKKQVKSVIQLHEAQEVEAFLEKILQQREAERGQNS